MEEFIQSADYAVLSTAGKEGPYGVAIHFALAPDGTALYFHTKKSGKKMENLRRNPAVSLFITGPYRVAPEKFSTRFESAVLTGRAEEVEEPEEKRLALRRICEKYCPGQAREREVTEKYFDAVGIVKVWVTEIKIRKKEA